MLILIILISVIIGSWCKVMADEFIKIPSYLIEENIETNIQPMVTACTGCLDFCEVYNECCGYEDCQSTSENGCTTGCEGGACETTCESTCQNCEGVVCQTAQNPADGATLTISGISKTYFTATVSGLDTSMGIPIRIEWYLSGNLYYTTLTSNSSASIDVTGLSAGNSYTLVAKIYNNNTGSLLETLQKTVTTSSSPQLPTPTLDTTATVKTANSFTVTINPVSGADSYYFRINGGAIVDNGTMRTHMFTGLTPNTQYFIEIKVGGSGYIDSNWAGYYATTLVAILWEWWYPKISGDNFNLTAEEWIAFCEKINEVRVLNGLSSIDFTIDNPYLAKGNPFYAWIFKKAANAINQINGQVAVECLNVMPGDDIYAWYFENLKTALNNAIQ